MRGTEAVPVLFAAGVVYHAFKTGEIGHHERPTAPLDYAELLQSADLTRDGFAVRADPACNFRVRRRRIDFVDGAAIAGGARHSKKLAVNAVGDRQGAELDDAARQRPKLGYEVNQDRLHECRVGFHQLAE